LGFDGFLEGLCGEAVLVCAGDLLVLGHFFGEHAHGDFAVLGFGVGIEELGEFGDGLRAVSVSAGCSIACC